MEQQENRLTKEDLHSMIFAFKEIKDWRYEQALDGHSFTGEGSCPTSGKKWRFFLGEIVNENKESTYDCLAYCEELNAMVEIPENLSKQMLGMVRGKSN